MHAAPPVRVSLGCSPAWTAFESAAWAAAAANIMAWAMLLISQAEGLTGAAALASALVGAVVGARWSWRRQESGVLSWDGAVWRWRGLPCSVRVAIDWDSRLLLSIRSDRCGWIAAERCCIGADWTALRAALFAPAAPDAEPALAG